MKTTEWMYAEVGKIAEPVLPELETKYQSLFWEAFGAAELAEKELESFCSCISHDLRAPLRHINSYSALLLEDFADFLPLAAQEYLQCISRSSCRMGQMIDQLLELSQLNRTDLLPGEVDLSEMARQVLQRLKKADTSREVETVVAATTPVVADMTMLLQVMENILGNAWKFTSRKRDARIEFGVTKREDQEAFFIKDNGVGFDMEYTPKLFGPFERLHGPEFEGAGIGLATAARIISRHGGKIWGEGVTDEGATFYFTLPVVSSPFCTHSIDCAGKKQTV